MQHLMKLIPCCLQSLNVFYAWLVLFLILLDCSLLLASNYIKLRCEVMALLLPESQAVEMSTLKLIHYFFGHLAAFVFWASLPPDSITLNHAKKMIEQSLSDFHTGIAACPLATLDTEQLISHTRTTLVDTIPSLQDSDGGVIMASEVHD